MSVRTFGLQCPGCGARVRIDVHPTEEGCPKVVRCFNDDKGCGLVFAAAVSLVPTIKYYLLTLQQGDPNGS